MKNKKTLIITSIIMIVAICIGFTIKTLQNDTFYTIKVGESIIKNGIDMVDHFSYHNLPYTYPHWLYDIVTYEIYHLFGFKGLYISTIIVFICLGLSLYFINLKLNRSYFISLFFSVLGTIMIANFITARAQLITYILFLLEIYFIEELLNNGKIRYGIYMMIICLLIANLHAAVWPFYFILMLPYILEFIVTKISTKVKTNHNSKILANKLIIEENNNTKKLLIIFGISLFIGLLTPIHFAPYTYFIKTILGNTQTYIEEHKPLILIKNYFVMGYLVFLLIPLIFTKVKIKLTDIAMIGGLLLMSFISVRHVALLAVVGIFYLTRLICNIGKINSTKSLDLDIPKIGNLVLVVTVIIISSLIYTINSNKDYIDETKYPVDMVDYIYEELDVDNIKLYNDYDFGSYLIYRKLPVFIDSRSDLYTKPFNKENDIFDECMNITTNYGRIFKKYDITHILIYRNTNLNQILTASPNYKLIKKDKYFSLFEYINNSEQNN